MIIAVDGHALEAGVEHSTLDEHATVIGMILQATAVDVDHVLTIHARSRALEQRVGHEGLIPVGDVNRRAIVLLRHVARQLIGDASSGELILRSHAVEQVVGHEAVERVAAVGGVGHTSVFGVHLVIHLGGVCLEVGKGADAIERQGLVGLHEGGEALAQLLQSIRLLVAIKTLNELMLKVVVIVIDGAQRVTQTGELQGLVEDFDVGVLGHHLGEGFHSHLTKGDVVDVLHGDDVTAPVAVDMEKLLCI